MTEEERKKQGELYGVSTYKDNNAIIRALSS
jgi:hypothetical protein